MPYSRKQIILKYKSKSIILTLESKDGQIGFSIPLEGMGELIIFKNETNFLKLGDKRNGKMKCGYSASEIVAAAIIKNGEINYSGGVQSFNWKTAKTKMFPPKTKEEYYYREIYSRLFPSDSAAKVVPHEAGVACSTAKALEWDAAWKNMDEPSGRAIAGVHDKAY